MVVIIFGVSGAGKTTIGELLAQELGWQFYEADDFHPRANIEKMRRVNAGVKLVFLRGEYELIANQLRHRRAHFMNPALLQSQFADLEEPQATEGSIVIELGQGPHKLVQELKRKLRIRR